MKGVATRIAWSRDIYLLGLLTPAVAAVLPDPFRADRLAGSDQPLPAGPVL